MSDYLYFRRRYVYQLGLCVNIERIIYVMYVSIFITIEQISSH